MGVPFMFSIISATFERVFKAPIVFKNSQCYIIEPFLLNVQPQK